MKSNPKNAATQAFVRALYEDPDDETMSTGWCHGDEVCLVLARLHGRAVSPVRDDLVRQQTRWPDDTCVCCGCGKFINEE